jgi:hypothetical protein
MRSLALAGLFLSASALAQGAGAQLEPDDAIFGYEWRLDYYSNVARVLGNVVPDQSPKVYVLPSNMREYVVGIDDEEGSCAIVFGRVEYTLWVYESRKENPELQRLTSEFPDDPLDVEVAVETQPAARHFCDRIREAWLAVLLETRYPEPDHVRLGLDGVSFHFSVWLRRMGMLNGKIWSPEEQTIPGQLVALTFAMRNYARSGSRDELGNVQSALAELEGALE